MTDTKFTPGPWVADDEAVFSSWESGNQKMIGRVFDDDDAHLIAAAPELYEALQAMADDYEEYGYNPETGRWDVPLFNKSVHDMARAALAKARGE